MVNKISSGLHEFLSNISRDSTKTSEKDNSTDDTSSVTDSQSTNSLENDYSSHSTFSLLQAKSDLLANQPEYKKCNLQDQQANYEVENVYKLDEILTEELSTDFKYDDINLLVDDNPNTPIKNCKNLISKLRDKSDINPLTEELEKNTVYELSEDGVYDSVDLRTFDIDNRIDEILTKELASNTENQTINLLAEYETHNTSVFEQLANKLIVKNYDDSDIKLLRNTVKEVEPEVIQYRYSQQNCLDSIPEEDSFDIMDSLNNDGEDYQLDDNGVYDKYTKYNNITNTQNTKSKPQNLVNHTSNLIKPNNVKLNDSKQRGKALIVKSTQNLVKKEVNSTKQSITTPKSTETSKLSRQQLAEKNI